MTEEKKKKFKRLSISLKGSTMSVTQPAKNLSEAIEQELNSHFRTGIIPVQINIEEEWYDES